MVRALTLVRPVEKPALVRGGPLEAHDCAYPEIGALAKWEDTYVLLRERRMAGMPFIRAWIVRHELSCGFRPDHAARFERILVVGEPAGLDLEGCDVAYVQEDNAEALFRREPSVASFFGERHGRFA